jgi:hypothetical protein
MTDEKPKEKKEELTKEEKEFLEKGKKDVETLEKLRERRSK